jgi:DNA-binding response OmpR family regulator
VLRIAIAAVHEESRMPKVCLIDDDLFVRDALSLGLSDAGFEVVTAPGAAAGLDIVLRGGIDAIVTDMNMPGVNGSQLISDVRARWADLPLVAMTGASTIDGRPAEEVARKLGADVCMIKPFRAAQLAATLNALLTG